MTKVPVYNQKAEIINEIELPEEIFNLPWNPVLVHQVMRWQSLNTYFPWAHTKDRSEVRGGGRKPWPQKGTGRARHGSIRSPIWRGGGVTFGPRKENIKQIKINKKMRKKAILTVLAQKLRDNELKILETFKTEAPKTKLVENFLKNFLAPRKKKKYQSVLLALEKNDPLLIRSVRNLPYAKAIEARNLNVLDLLNHKFLFLTPQAIEVIKDTFLEKQNK